LRDCGAERIEIAEEEATVMSRRIALSLVCIVLVIQGVEAADQSPNYLQRHPESALRLGKGFKQNDLTFVPESDCLSFTEQTRPEGADQIQLRTTVVSNYESLLDTMGFSAEASFHNPVSNFDARYSEERKRTSDTRNVTIVVSASAEYAHIIAKDPDLKPEFKDLLTAGRIDEFLTKCGARYPASERRGVSVNAVITILEASQELRQKTSGSISGGYGSGAISASAKAAFDKEIQTATSSNRYEVSVFGRGGDASVLFDQLMRAAIKSKASIDDIGAALAAYADTLDQKNAITLGFFLADMPGVSTALSDPWSLEKQRLLQSLTRQYKTLADRRGILEALIGRTDPRAARYSLNDHKNFIKQRDELDAAIARVLAWHSGCKKELAPILDSCRGSSPEVQAALAIVVPAAIVPPRARFLVATAEEGQYSLLSEIESDAIFRSPIAANRPRGIDFEFADHGVRWAERVSGSGAKGTSAAMVLLVEAAELESLEVFATPTKEDDKLSVGFSASAWARGTFQPTMSVGPQWGTEAAEAKKLLVLSVASLSPTSSASAALPVHISVVGEMVRAVKKWIQEGTTAGTGKLTLRAYDTFGGGTEFQLLNWAWDYEKTLGIAQVSYRFGTGEPEDIGYIVGLSEASKRFPTLDYHDQLSGEIPGPGRVTHPFPTVVARWPEMVIKACNIEARFDKFRGLRQYARLVAEKEGQVFNIKAGLDLTPGFSGYATVVIGAARTYSVMTRNGALTSDVATWLASNEGCEQPTFELTPSTLTL
jgi:hypothetical protein